MKQIIALFLTIVMLCSISPVAIADGGDCEQNGKNLDALSSTIPALVIGGNEITKGHGFLNNVTYLSAEDMEQIRASNSGEITYKLGLGDSFTNGVITYSTYENHGTPTWNYRRVCGLDLKVLAEALGINTERNLAVAVSSDDGASTVLSDAFDYSAKRYYFNPQGTTVCEVMPILALYETASSSYDAPGKDNTVVLPELPALGENSSNSVQPLFGYGQTKTDEINNCFWIKYVNKLRIGSESPALIVTTAEGKTITASISSIVLKGIYKTSYNFEQEHSKTAITDNVTGIPLTTLLSGLGVETGKVQSIFAIAADGTERSISSAELPYWFAAWDATENGSSVNNNTALRLYGPGQYEDAVVFADLVSLKLTNNDANYFQDLNGYDWAKDAINYLYQNNIVTGTSESTYEPAAAIKRGDFMLMLYRAFDLSATTDGCFNDVSETSYYYNAIAVARALGIAKGNGSSFDPEGAISRQDAMVLLYRTLAVKGIHLVDNADLFVFSDASEVDSYATIALQALVGAGVIDGADGKLDPNGNMTRAQMAQILYKTLHF